MTMDVFDRYSPFIRDYIYRLGWRSLRAVQNAAGDAIFNTDGNVLLTASTASGKTEAAFFPILTLLEENPSSTVGVLYIAPLKALINDQFERLDGLCEEAGIRQVRQIYHGAHDWNVWRRCLRDFAKLLFVLQEIVLQSQKKAFGMFGSHHNATAHFGLLHAGEHGGQVDDNLGLGMGEDGQVCIHALCHLGFQFNLNLLLFLFVCHCLLILSLLFI